MLSSSSGFAMLNDNCVNWVSNAEQIAFDQASQHQEQEQQQQNCGGQVYKVDSHPVDELILQSTVDDDQVGNAFDGFDFEFVESAFIPPQTSYNCSLTSMDDQLAWDIVN